MDKSIPQLRQTDRQTGERGPWLRARRAPPRLNALARATAVEAVETAVEAGAAAAAAAAAAETRVVTSMVGAAAVAET